MVARAVSGSGISERHAPTSVDRRQGFLRRIASQFICGDSPRPRRAAVTRPCCGDMFGSKVGESFTAERRRPRKGDAAFHCRIEPEEGGGHSILANRLRWLDEKTWEIHEANMVADL
jgi:hypothetical protein